MQCGIGNAAYVVSRYPELPASNGLDAVLGGRSDVVWRESSVGVVWGRRRSRKACKEKARAAVQILTEILVFVGLRPDQAQEQVFRQVTPAPRQSLFPFSGHPLRT